MLQFITNTIMKIPRVKEVVLRAATEKAIEDLEIAGSVTTIVHKVSQRMANAYSINFGVIQDIEALIKENKSLVADVLVELHRVTRVFKASKLPTLLNRCAGVAKRSKGIFVNRSEEASKQFELIEKDVVKESKSISDNLQNIASMFKETVKANKKK